MTDSKTYTPSITTNRFLGGSRASNDNDGRFRRNTMRAPSKENLHTGQNGTGTYCPPFRRSRESKDNKYSAFSGLNLNREKPNVPEKPNVDDLRKIPKLGMDANVRVEDDNITKSRQEQVEIVSANHKEGWKALFKDGITQNTEPVDDKASKMPGWLYVYKYGFPHGPPTDRSERAVYYAMMTRKTIMDELRQEREKERRERYDWFDVRYDGSFTTDEWTDSDSDKENTDNGETTSDSNEHDYPHSDDYDYDD